jgi:hypothetical protein
MISSSELRKIARERHLPLDLIEKDYTLGWILWGVARSSTASNLVFKGGTALSKIYFPLDWRISDDLDFTLIGDLPLGTVSQELVEELPGIVADASTGIQLIFKDKPFVNPGYSQTKVQFVGPISKNTVKIEVTKESYIGDSKSVKVPKKYDYVSFDVPTYTLNNILAEKLRTLIERKRIRDYYDSWKLLKLKVVDPNRVDYLFRKKCEGKGISFEGLEQFFPEDIVENLKPHLPDLTRMTAEPLPTLEKMINELRTNLKTVII